MFGVSGAVSSIRFISSQVAKQTLKKLPQQALTKTIWYPVVKQIGKSIGVKVTKNTVAKGCLLYTSILYCRYSKYQR